MTKEEHGKLADFFYDAFTAEKGKEVSDDFLIRYFQEMMLFHEDKSKRYTKEY